MRIYGDSKYVCDLLNRSYLANDIFMYNCAMLVSDLLKCGHPFVCSWIPREENATCDKLAREAVATK